MRLLVIGGTSFVGRHAVEHAVAEGHDVTVFHRGRTNAELLAGRIAHRTGDRKSGDYASLDTGETWDAVVDVCAYYPRAVEQLADVLGSRVGHCVHISSISAYDDEAITSDEDSPLAADLADPNVEAVTGETYGPLKAMCERAAIARFGPEHTAVIRPTYVVGPWDKTDRFTYWVRRMARGGDVAVVSPAAPLQVVDGRDLGAFIVRCAIEGAAGAFDGVGPFAPLSEMLATATPAGVDHRLVDVGGAALAASGVGPAAAVTGGDAEGVPDSPGHAGSRRRPHQPSARRHRRRPARLGPRPRRAPTRGWSVPRARARAARLTAANWSTRPTRFWATDSPGSGVVCAPRSRKPEDQSRPCVAMPRIVGIGT